MVVPNLTRLRTRLLLIGLDNVFGSLNVASKVVSARRFFGSTDTICYCNKNIKNCCWYASNVFTHIYISFGCAVIYVRSQHKILTYNE